MGLQIPGYRVLRLLGEGGMGCVYLAEDLALRRRVAIKVLAEDLATDPEARARFQREAEVMATVDSPHVVRIHTFGEADGEVYFIMEYIDGESLARKISREGRLPVDEALRIATECAGALAAAWTKDVVHRDVKPANVLLDRQGAVHLADFGIARPLREGQPITASERSLLICTPHYVAPERARGDARVDLRADIYSLGIVLFEMLTGQRPFRGRTPGAVIAESLSAPLPDLRALRPELAEALVRLVERMTRKDPARRPNSWRELRDAFDDLRAGTTPATEDRSEIARLAIPSYLGAAPSAAETTVTPFVERRDELARLAALLAAAVEGRGSVVFVTGEAGTGKTALIAEFMRRARAERPDLVVAGAGFAGGPGPRDPYAPFREILGLLTGDVRARYEAGALSRDEALRLWNLMPASIDALLDAGPDLAGTLLPTEPLLRRAREAAPRGAPWLERLARQLERDADGAGSPARQVDWFAQYARMLEQLARASPLLLVFDDLQWSDPGSIGLLAHLGGSITGRRILLVGAYRPSEIHAPDTRSPHPLQSIVDEVTRRSGDSSIHLRQEGSRSFVDSLLDLEPNRLDEAFRSSLHSLTQGHPLFTVELLRSLREQGGLARDEEGRWIVTASLCWDVIPPRVDAVLGARLRHLGKAARTLLAAASVEGETFTAEAVADAVGRSRDDALLELSGTIGAEHRLVTPQGLEEAGARRISRYRFSHILFQRHLYRSLDEATRSCLHEALGRSLESLYGEAAPRIAGELAVHFGRGGCVERAVHFRRLAARRAMTVGTAEEATAHIDDALELLDRLEPSPERTRQKIGLLVARTASLLTSVGWLADGIEATLSRAIPLAEHAGDCPELSDALWILANARATRKEHALAIDAARAALEIAERLHDPRRQSMAYGALGFCLMCEGDLARARECLEAGLALGWPHDEEPALFGVIQNPEGLHRMFHGTTVRMLGFHDRARASFERAVASATAGAEPGLLALTIWHRTLAHVEYGEIERARDGLSRLETLTAEQEMLFMKSLALHIRGCLLQEERALEDAVAVLQSSVDLQLRIGGRHPLSFVARDLARALGLAGELDSGLTVIDRAIAAMAETGDRYVEPELYRVRAELLLMRDGTEARREAEALLERALAVARTQASKSWELRAAMILGRLWHEQGRRDEARALVAETFAWFTEGLDTRDLRNAAAMLEAWS